MKARADFYESFKAEFIASKRLKNRLIKYWGTEYVDGVHVFKKKFVLYPGTDTPRVRKITNLLGITKDIANARFDSIEEYYLYFNPKKSTNLSDYTIDIITNKINSFMRNGETRTIDLNIVDQNDPSKFLNMSEQQILDYVDLNYTTILDSHYVEARGDTIVDDTLGIYVLLDDGTHFDIKVESATIRPIPNKVNNGFSFVEVFTSGISLSLSFTKISNVTDSSDIVLKMHSEQKELIAGKIKRFLDAKNKNSSDESLITNNTIKLTNEIWYKDQLRVAVTDPNVMRSRDFGDLLGAILDTGYIKKKVKWYKKVLTFVLFAIAIYFSAITGGGSLKAFALYMSIVTIVIAGIQLVLAKSGEEGWAEYMGSYVQISSFLSIVAGYSAMISNIAKQGITTAIATSIAYGAANSALISIIATGSVDTKIVAQGAASGSGGVVAVTTETTARQLSSIAMQMVIKIVQLRENMKAKELQSQISEQSDRARELDEELQDIEDKSLNIGVEDIKWYTSPLSVENNQFRVDYLYEGTKYNILRPSFNTGRALNIIT